MPDIAPDKSARAQLRSSDFARTLSESASTLMLTQRDFEAFVKVMEQPPKPRAALRKLMAS